MTKKPTKRERRRIIKNRKVFDEDTLKIRDRIILSNYDIAKQIGKNFATHLILSNIRHEKLPKWSYRRRVIYSLLSTENNTFAKANVKVLDYLKRR